MALLAISANDIEVSGLSLDVSLPVEWLTAELSDADVTASAPGHLAARLSRSGNDIVVRGRVQAKVAMPCARCLAPAAVDVDAELSLLLRPEHKPEANRHGRGRDHAGANGNGGSPARGAAAKAKEPEYEFTAEEAELDTYDGETVVLDPFVREAILLEMPNFPLCSESCPGIAPAVSADEGDPRLAALSALRDKLGQRSVEASDKPPPADSSSPAKPGTKKKSKKE